MWGTENKVDTPEQCCAQCAAYKPQHEDDIYCNGAPFSECLQPSGRWIIVCMSCTSLLSACALGAINPVPVQRM